jgi:hypothetical protein
LNVIVGLPWTIVYLQSNEWFARMSMLLLIQTVVGRFTQRLSLVPRSLLELLLSPTFLLLGGSRMIPDVFFSTYAVLFDIVGPVLGAMQVFAVVRLLMYISSTLTSALHRSESDEEYDFEERSSTFRTSRMLKSAIVLLALLSFALSLWILWARIVPHEALDRAMSALISATVVLSLVMQLLSLFMSEHAVLSDVAMVQCYCIFLLWTSLDHYGQLQERTEQQQQQQQSFFSISTRAVVEMLLTAASLLWMRYRLAATDNVDRTASDTTDNSDMNELMADDGSGSGLQTVRLLLGRLPPWFSAVVWEIALVLLYSYSARCVLSGGVCSRSTAAVYFDMTLPLLALLTYLFYLAKASAEDETDAISHEKVE